MKVLVVVFLLTVFVTVMSAPSPQELEGGKVEIDPENKVYIRHRRITCDLLEGSGNMFCAAHCIALGKTGGTCNDGVCICRRETISSLWPDQAKKMKTNVLDLWNFFFG